MSKRPPSHAQSDTLPQLNLERRESKGKPPNSVDNSSHRHTEIDVAHSNKSSNRKASDANTKKKSF